MQLLDLLGVAIHERDHHRPAAPGDHSGAWPDHASGAAWFRRVPSVSMSAIGLIFGCWIGVCNSPNPAGLEELYRIARCRQKVVTSIDATGGAALVKSDQFEFSESDIDKPDIRQELIRVYEMIWRNMERENNLIHYRSSWGLGLSAGTFTAQALLANLITSGKANNIVIFSIMLFLSIIALLFCLGSRTGVNAAISQIDYLRDHYWRFGVDDTSNIFQARLRLPRPFGHLLDHAGGHQVARIFPLAMVCIWAIAAIVEFVAIVYLGISARGH